jgi:hypothetical protein
MLLQLPVQLRKPYSVTLPVPNILCTSTVSQLSQICNRSGQTLLGVLVLVQYRVRLLYVLALCVYAGFGVISAFTTDNLTVIDSKNKT